MLPQFGALQGGDLTRSQSAFGFPAGEMGKAVVSVRFPIQTGNGLVHGIHQRFCTLMERADGYGYSWNRREGSLRKGEAGMGRSVTARLSLLGLNAEVYRPIA